MGFTEEYGHHCLSRHLVNMIEHTHKNNFIDDGLCYIGLG